MKLRHARVELALHAVRAGSGTPLLVLHELGGAGRDAGAAPPWSGPVYALDFSGHGESGRVRGSVYTPELLAGDADVALAEIGAAVLAGRGLGAWVALLLAGGRPDAVHAAVLAPGAGLAGGGPQPSAISVELERGLLGSDPEQAARDGAPDPGLRALACLVRPPDYAKAFAAAARRLLLVEDGGERPPWWHAVRATPRCESAPDLPAALALASRLLEDDP